MPTVRPFAYNPSPNPPISGTTQVGDLAVGYTNVEYSSNYGGLTWWEGPDEDLGYVIAHPSPTGYQPNPLMIPAYVGFWRTPDLTDGSFISLAEYVSVQHGTPQTFATANDANTWLTNNGYWNSYGGSFTITSARVTSEGAFGAAFSSVSTNGYVMTDNYNNQLYPAYYFSISDSNADILNVFNKAGIPTNYQGYIFNVTWGPGSTYSTLAKVAYNSTYNQMYMIAVDPSNPAWQNNNTIQGTALIGTFNFPATFTPYYPLTDKNDWC